MRRAPRDSRGHGGRWRRAHSPTPAWPPRHYRGGPPRICPSGALPTLTPRCPLGSSGAGRRRLRGSTPPSHAPSPGRSSRRGYSGLADYGVFATALVTVGFFQTLLDLTVEESLTKFGFRYVAGEDWGRLRRLFRQALFLKLAGGVRRDDAPHRARAVRRRAVRRGTTSSRRSSRPRSSPWCRPRRTSVRPCFSCTAATTCGASTRLGSSALRLLAIVDRRALRRDRGAARDRRRSGDLVGRDLRGRRGRSSEVPDRVTEANSPRTFPRSATSCSSRAWRPA